MPAFLEHKQDFVDPVTPMLFEVQGDVKVMGQCYVAASDRMLSHTVTLVLPNDKFWASKMKN